MVLAYAGWSRSGCRGDLQRLRRPNRTGLVRFPGGPVLPWECVWSCALRCHRIAASDTICPTRPSRGRNRGAKFAKIAGSQFCHDCGPGLSGGDGSRRGCDDFFVSTNGQPVG